MLSEPILYGDLVNKFKIVVRKRNFSDQFKTIIKRYIKVGYKKKSVSMIRIYHNHKPQTIPWHREEEPLNHYETLERQIKQL